MERRQRAGGSSSEANVDVLRYQLAHADALEGDERDCVIEVATDKAVDIDRLISENFCRS
jgi:hypothetical protein